nr:tRNA-splicing endonuclease subunit Sen34 isoform X2 [Caretta caretta]
MHEFTPLRDPVHEFTPLRAIPSPTHPAPHFAAALPARPPAPCSLPSRPAPIGPCNFQHPPHQLSAPPRVLANGAVAQLQEPRPPSPCSSRERDRPVCFANSPRPTPELGAGEPRGEDTAEDSGLLDSPFVLPRGSMMVQLPTARRHPGRVERVDWTSPSPDWPHAGCPAHEARYRVFRELWGRGYYLSGGSKFGGDFLVYPGDPLRFHAHYIALCCPQGAPLPLRTLVAAARLGTGVKKTLLLCSPGPSGALAFTSLQWSGLQ